MARVSWFTVGINGKVEVYLETEPHQEVDDMIHLEASLIPTDYGCFIFDHLIYVLLWMLRTSWHEVELIQGDTGDVIGFSFDYHNVVDSTFTLLFDEPYLKAIDKSLDQVNEDAFGCCGLVASGILFGFDSDKAYAKINEYMKQSKTA